MRGESGQRKWLCPKPPSCFRPRFHPPPVLLRVSPGLAAACAFPRAGVEETATGDEDMGALQHSAALCRISYHGSGEGGESDDSEGENQELAQIDRERRRNCALTPLATSQQHNQGPLSPARLRRLRLLLDANLDRHSSEEELERISCGDNRKWVSAFHGRHGDHHSSASSDEEVRDLCGCGSPAGNRALEPGACLATSPSPVLFSSSPPRTLKPPSMRFQLQVVQPVTRPIILTHFDQAAPYRKYRHSYGGELGRPSLDLEKMQQKMLLKKNCGGKTRTIKIRNLTSSSRPPPRYTYDPSIFAFRSLSTVPPCSPLNSSEDPPCS
ncbi:uncharacterized protein si:dkey-16j16.4 isoform X1 [Boleophthalmus pectinirostris]|uniref:uncharacterized protein si:dkey-16j16.4 isoform X1 n=1 Tax=Boleophthalmus pectinirostris TaxID=150288 RepID=UPI000A1C64E5|nr:uncharacterized protein si:dkey-16j16.4 isoform X1 [Boleophthalmus pectinirostris]